MPRGIRKKARQYVLDRFQEEDPESYFKYKMHSGLNQDQMELLQAISSQSVHLVKAHLNKGIDPNFTVVPGKVTPLHIAVKNYVPQNSASEKILRSLLFFGANTEAADMNGNTPLHDACKYHSIESVGLLVQAGADLDRCNNSEETPLMMACRCPKDPTLPIVELLISAGAITIITNSDGQTALHILSASAASKASYEMIRHEIALLLMKHGLRADEEDKLGKTALSYEMTMMTHCAASSTFPDDLQKKGTNMYSVVSTAVCLVQGGAMHTSPYVKELESFIQAASMHQHGLSLLRSFLVSICKYVSLLIWKRICRTISHISTRSTLIAGFQNSLNSLLTPEVPSLAQLAKVSIRTSLGGSILQNVNELLVPEKVKAFIISDE